MKVGVPTEIKEEEYRVALTAVGARELAEHGHEVLIQKGAGEGSAIADADYEAQGARIVPTPPTRSSREADMILKVKEPQPVEVGMLRPETDPVHLPASGAGAGADEGAAARPARPASPTRRSRTAKGGCRCWRR